MTWWVFVRDDRIGAGWIREKQYPTWDKAMKRTAELRQHGYTVEMVHEGSYTYRKLLVASQKAEKEREAEDDGSI